MRNREYEQPKEQGIPFSATMSRNIGLSTPLRQFCKESKRLGTKRIVSHRRTESRFSNLLACEAQLSKDPTERDEVEMGIRERERGKVGDALRN